MGGNRPTRSAARVALVRASPPNWSPYKTGTPSTPAKAKRGTSARAGQSPRRSASGSSTARASTNRHSTTCVNGIAARATFPNRNDAPHSRHEPTRAASVGRVERRGVGVDVRNGQRFGAAHRGRVHEGRRTSGQHSPWTLTVARRTSALGVKA